MIELKIQRSKRGIVLVTAVVVLMVLFIMGIAILAMSSNEAKLTARQYNRTQAYYAARSGAEIGLQKIDDAIISSVEPLTEVADLFTLLSGFSGNVQSGQNFTVTYIDEVINDDQIKIFSQGSDQGVNETTAITLYVNNPFFDMRDWINPAGIIIADSKERAEAPVVVKVGKKVGTAPKKESSKEPTIWTSPAIHFLDNADGLSLEITGKTLMFNTKLLSFEHKVYIKNINDDNFVINNFKGEGLLDDSEPPQQLLMNSIGDEQYPKYMESTWSVVVFREGLVDDKNSVNFVLEAGHYAVAPGLQLSNVNDPVNVDNIIKITNQETIKYIDNIIKRNTSLQVDMSNIIWSEK